MQRTLGQRFWFLIVGVGVLLSQQSWAQSGSKDNHIIKDVEASLFADSRLRYQILEQDNLETTGEALTLSIRGGIEVEFFDLFSSLIEIEGSHQFIDNFNDGTNDQFDTPLIIDVEGVELNRLQLQTEVIPNTRLTVGRQNFALDNWRFLGNWQFRQNDQTFDATRAEITLGKARVNLGYFNTVYRHLGEDSPAGEFSGDSYVINVSHPAPFGQVSLFHYALDLETGPPEAPNNTLSSQTTGIRWHGRWHWKDFDLAWDTSFARQSEYADNPNDYGAYYRDIGIDVQIGKIELGAGLEVLGSDDGVSIQTPLGSLHSFQGVTDRFFSTPEDGLQDFHGSLGLDIGRVGPFERIQAVTGYHLFKSDKNDRNYGREFNVGLSGKINNVALLFEFGNYDSLALPRDTGLFDSDARSVIFSTSYSFD